MSIIGSIFVRLGLKSDEFSKGIKQSEGQLSSFKGVVGKIGGAIAGAFTVDKIVQFTKEAYKLAGQAQGVYNAFSRLNRPGLLNDLKEATRGTTDELKLMQTAVQANNFKIPLDQLATYLKFATNRAIETGESVDYLVQSIILGIGRKSPLILDNLGISASELREELAKTGDMGKAVGNIINKSMSEAGDAIETSAVKTQKLGAAWKNFMTSVGDTSVVKSTGDAIVSTLTYIADSFDALINSERLSTWQKFLGFLGHGGIQRQALAEGAGNASADKQIQERVNLWTEGLNTIELAERQLAFAQSQYAHFSSEEEKKAVISALKERVKLLKSQEQEQIAREQTEKGIMAQIEALKELRAEEANPEKRAAYTSEIESLEKRLELMTSTKTRVDQINDAIDRLRKNREDATKEAQAGIDAEIEKLQSELDWINLTAEAYAKFLEVKSGETGNIAAGYSTKGTGGSFWLKRVEEKNKLEKDLASYSFDPTLYKNAKIQADRFREIAKEVEQTANSIHLTISGAMSDALISLAEGIGGMGGIDMSPLADVIIQVGKMAIRTGVAILGIKKALESLNPFVAIAAGTALVALGTAAKKSLSNIGSEIGGGYSPNTSFSGGGSYSGALSQYGYASYRAQSVDVNVTGRISGQDIVLASDKYLKNKSR